MPLAGFIYDWSLTAADNDDADSTINWLEGQLPGSVNGSARAMQAAIASLIKDINGTLTSGGSANAQTVTANIAFVALATGQMIGFKAGFSNTAAMTLAVNGLTAKAVKVIRTTGEADPSASQVRANGHYLFRYDAAANGAAGAWILLNPSVAADTNFPRLLTSGTLSAQATLEVVLTSYSEFSRLVFVFDAWRPNNDGVTWFARFSTDGGSSYDAGASDYGWSALTAADDAAALTTTTDTADTAYTFCPGSTGNLATEGMSGQFTLFSRLTAATSTRAIFDGVTLDDNGRFRHVRSVGGRKAAQDTDAIQFSVSASTITSGNWQLYGYV